MNEDDIDERDQHKVFCAAHAFYKENLAYILQNLPLNDSLENELFGLTTSNKRQLNGVVLLVSALDLFMY